VSIRVGVKIYSYAWFFRWGHDERSAAQWLRDHGIDFVIGLNRFVPMADNAVLSAQTGGTARRDPPSDEQWADALRAQGIEYWAACNVFFDPAALQRFPDAIPVDKCGRRAEQIDWYLGACPTHVGYLESKTQQIAAAARALKPDGIHLGFIRFPGFWELRVPAIPAAHHREYCFCSRCCARFAIDTGRTIPAEFTDAPWQWAASPEVYPAYSTWKAQVIAAAVEHIRDAVRYEVGSVPVMLNTLPFFPDEEDGALRNAYGQHWEILAPSVDVFEVMTYHQILDRPTSWIGDMVRCVRNRVSQSVAATIQVSPLYLEGMHAGHGRNPRLDPAEFRMALEEASFAGADRVVLFTWDDLLNADDVEVSRKLEMLVRVSEGRGS